MSTMIRILWGIPGPNRCTLFYPHCWWILPEGTSISDFLNKLVPIGDLIGELLRSHFLAHQLFVKLSERGGGERMRALGWWLLLVGSFRLASVWFGFFDIWALRLAVFSKTQSWYLSLFYVFFCSINFLAIKMPVDAGRKKM